MARQRTPRASKRNLVRWTDDMDKKLLLSIQSECNAQGVNIPWNNIAALVGPTITGSAVIQHLAKLRIRMVQQGMDVPPPLRRGGYQRISTGLSIPPSGRSANNPVPGNNDPPKPRQIRRKKMASADTDSDGYGSESDAEYGKPRAKRAKIRSKVKPRTPTPSTSESEEGIPSSKTSNVKRERSHSSNDESSAEDYARGGDEIDREGIVAAGADFLDLENDALNMGEIAQEPSKSLIVRLPAMRTIKPESRNLGTNNLDNLAIVASGLPAYTGTSAVGSYPAFDLPMQNLHNYSQPDHTHNTSRFLSAGYGSMDGLPENNLYGNMISQPHGYYPNEFQQFSDTHLGDQGMAEDGLHLANSDYQFGGSDGSRTLTTPFLSAHGMSNTPGHPPSSRSHLSTSFVSEPAGQEDIMGGDYRSPRMSTMNHTPSSIMPDESANAPWLNRDGSSAQRTNDMDLDNVDTVQPSNINPFHEQYDGYGDDNIYY